MQVINDLLYKDDKTRPNYIEPAEKIPPLKYT